MSVMDEYLFQFICDEMRLQNSLEVSNWQKTLCRMIESMLDNGMPMEGLKYRSSFQIEMWQARNAEESLLAVLNACARVTREISEIKWSHRASFGEWISRLQGQRVDIENVLAFECFSFLNLEGCILHIRDFIRANFASTNLENAALNYAIFLGANLLGTNLTKADLTRSAFVGANLKDANLQGANLFNANLENANLQGANLQGTNLQLAIFFNANLEAANLVGANLQWANLYEANLQGANLKGAIIEGANLQGANLKGTILEGQDIATLTKSSNEDSDES
jgi:uncharacterized protein YjbI with pentapeptide repeats